MTLAELASWLRCPRCHLPLGEAGALTLACPSGHHFDTNKRGYLNALNQGGGITGDSADILAARSAFLAEGFYSPIAAAVAERIPPARAGASTQVLDSGCGTGYYLARMLEGTSPPQSLALDVSVAAVVSTLRTAGGVGLVADVWKELPVRDSRADVITCIFAPRNAPEFARILRTDGTLIVVTPSPNHLAQLRDSGRMIGIQTDKLRHLDATLSPHFTLRERTRLNYGVVLTPRAQDLVIGMGPSGHHPQSDDSAIDSQNSDTPGSSHGSLGVTIEVDVSEFTTAGFTTAGR
ncbi:MAG: putative RNA methyltransferase [Microbacteriaceae bacterium]